LIENQDGGNLKVDWHKIERQLNEALEKEGKTFRFI